MKRQSLALVTPFLEGTVASATALPWADENMVLGDGAINEQVAGS